MTVEKSSARDATAADEAHLKALVKFTALSFKTPRPVPFGALIVDSETGETLMRARNAVAIENDPRRTPSSAPCARPPKNSRRSL